MTNVPINRRNDGSLAWLRVAAATVTLVGLLATPTNLPAQRGGGGGGSKVGNSSDSKATKEDEKQADKPLCPEITGKHLLLERMTADYDLTCPQQDKIEPILHLEESVSKPLLSFNAFTVEEKQAMMLKIKLAARVQIRPLLTPDQQKKSDAEAASLTDTKKANKKDAVPKKVAKQDDPFKGEEELSAAIAAYTAFSVKERQQLILEVKQAARRDGAPTITSDQQTKIDADIKVLQQQLS